MVLYICNPCGKPFDHKANYEKHMSRKKPCKPPLENSEIPVNNNVIVDVPILLQHPLKNNIIIGDVELNDNVDVDELQNIHTCVCCNNTYSNSCNLARHYKTCQAKQQLDQKYQADIDIFKQKYQSEITVLKHQYELSDNNKNNEINNLKHQCELLNKDIDIKNKDIDNLKHQYELFFTMKNNEIDGYKKEIENKNKLIEQLTNTQIDSAKQEVEYLKTLVNGAGGVIKTSFNALTYITTNFKTTPVLLPISDESIITKNDKNFVNEVIYSYTIETLDQKIGNIIVGHYKKTDPQQQSFWTSDVSRLTYMARILTNDKEDWFIDKKGIKIKSHIIDPILNDYIKPLVLKYLNEQQDSIRHTTDGGKLENIFDYMKTANLIIKSIDESSLAEDIIRYIASHFYIQKADEVKLLKNKPEIKLLKNKPEVKKNKQLKLIKK